VRTERERGQPVPKIKQETIRIPPVLETGDTDIGIANDDYVSGRMASPPLLGL
jgi:hypothetical protein